MSNRILVVDDEEFNRDVCMRRLQRKGFSVVAAESGQQALEMLSHTPFDLVLLDHMMPGLSGIEVLKHLRQQFSQQDLPIIMVTAVTDSDSIAEALDLGANDYVTKPIDYSVAMARIRSQLSRKHAEAALRRSEERYALAARSANDGLWDWNLETEEMYYSPRWKEMLGYGEAELGSDLTEWTSRVHEHDRCAVEQALESHLKQEVPVFECDYRIRHRDGSYRWMSSRGMAVRDAAGKPLRMAGSASDVTEKVTRDALTGLPNRVLFHHRLELALERQRMHPEHRFAVLLLDIDHFKLINDSMGHVIGDHLLKEVAARLRGSVRDNSISGRGDSDSPVARLGADEYAILLESIASAHTAEVVTERILRVMRPAFRLLDEEIYISNSVGVVVSDACTDSADCLLRNADTALHAAKQKGRGTYIFFESSMKDLPRARLQMESDLRRAVDRQEFAVFYQPRVLLDTGEICGFEALVRWQHPTRGLISPAEFIPVAEETGLVERIGLWVLREACRQMQEWHQRFRHEPPLDIAVNLSVRQCRDPELIDKIAHILAETGLPPACLHLELTESLLLENLEEARELLLALKRLGVGLKIDDFGTGYSCLRYLCELPFDSLKIDRSFTLRLSCDPDSSDAEIVRTIVAMADNLKMGVIAEGVETPEHVASLRQMGCRFGQGYFFSRPVDAQRTEVMLIEQSVRFVHPDTPAEEGSREILSDMA